MDDSLEASRDANPCCPWSLVDVLERELEVGLLVAREGDRIDARVAGRAIRGLLRADGLTKTIEAQVGEAVGLDVFPDLVDRVRGRDQLGTARRVDAVEARATSSVDS